MPTAARVDAPATVDGGDTCWLDERTLAVGLGYRTNEAGVAALRDALPDVDVLKVPHHGGGTSTPELFDAVHAEVAVVSVGVGNDYGHPDPAMIDALYASGAQVWRTDLDGTITVTFDGPTPTVESAR